MSEGQVIQNNSIAKQQPRKPLLKKKVTPSTKVGPEPTAAAAGEDGEKQTESKKNIKAAAAAATTEQEESASALSTRPWLIAIVATSIGVNTLVLVLAMVEINKQGVMRSDPPLAWMVILGIVAAVSCAILIVSALAYKGHKSNTTTISEDVYSSVLVNSIISIAYIAMAISHIASFASIFSGEKPYTWSQGDSTNPRDRLMFWTNTMFFIEIMSTAVVVMQSLTMKRVGSVATD